MANSTTSSRSGPCWCPCCSTTEYCTLLKSMSNAQVYAIYLQCMPRSPPLHTLNAPASTSAWYTAASGTRRHPRKRRSRPGSTGPSVSDSRPEGVGERRPGHSAMWPRLCVLEEEDYGAANGSQHGCNNPGGYCRLPPPTCLLCTADDTARAACQSSHLQVVLPVLRCVPPLLLLLA